MTFTIINKIFFSILIAWRKRSIIDLLNVKSMGKIIYSTEHLAIKWEKLIGSTRVYTGAT